MEPEETSDSTPARPKHHSVYEAEEKDLKSNFMNMIKALKEEMKNSLKELKEETKILLSIQ